MEFIVADRAQVAVKRLMLVPMAVSQRAEPRAVGKGLLTTPLPDPTDRFGACNSERSRKQALAPARLKGLNSLQFISAGF